MDKQSLGRKEIYESLIKRIDRGELFCICPNIPRSKDLYWLKFEYPEIYHLKPPDKITGELWFAITTKGMQLRKELLEKAIKLIL